jgi:hypothetical protein
VAHADARILIRRPSDQEEGRLLERAHDCLEPLFLSGRTFPSLADFNTSSWTG